MTKKKMECEQIKIDELKPSEYNPRAIRKFEMENLKKSIQEFGFVQPIVINKDNMVIGGHQRLRAAIHLGFESVPCYRVDVSKKKEKILNLQLNKIHGNWDHTKLADVMTDLSLSDDFDDLVTGFSAGEINKLLQVKDIVKQNDKSENEEMECPECGHKFNKKET